MSVCRNIRQAPGNVARRVRPPRPTQPRSGHPSSWRAGWKRWIGSATIAALLVAIAPVIVETLLNGVSAPRRHDAPPVPAAPTPAAIPIPASPCAVSIINGTTSGNNGKGNGGTGNGNISVCSPTASPVKESSDTVAARISRAARSLKVNRHLPISNVNLEEPAPGSLSIDLIDLAFKPVRASAETCTSGTQSFEDSIVLAVDGGAPASAEWESTPPGYGHLSISISPSGHVDKGPVQVIIQSGRDSGGGSGRKIRFDRPVSYGQTISVSVAIKDADFLSITARAPGSRSVCISGARLTP
jgi:hypothetical protein